MDQSPPLIRLLSRRLIMGLLGMGMLVGGGWRAAMAQTSNDNLGFDVSTMTLAQLAELPVITASKKKEPLWQTAAALVVVTDDDIRRSGAANIPEAMRYVPGLDIAQINRHDWAISARGFNSRFANKQLVLEDGRTVYSPFSGGVYWEAVGPPIGEIERIEIIRGPGATVWGANAMNGVINLVTKSARENQGGVVSLSGGTEENRSVYAGYGFQPGRQTWARVYAEVLRTDASSLLSGRETGDASEAVRAGIRVEHDFSDTSHLLVQSEISAGWFDDPGTYPILTAPYRATIPERSNMTESHILTRWTREYAADSQITLQGFWSHEQRTQYRDDFANDTFDLELTHQLPVGERNAIVWGAGGRFVTHDLVGQVGVVFPDPHPKDEVVNLFVQDEIQLRPRQLSLTVGTKVEHNNVTGLELEPSVRLTWLPTEKQTVWAAASRSVHTPSVLERNVQFDAAVFGGPPLTIARQISEGNSAGEEQIAYELGYRLQPAASLNFDATVFYNDLPKVQAFRQGTPFQESVPAPSHYVLPLIFDKTGLHGESRGLEFQVRWQVADHWRLVAEYSCLDVQLNTMPGLTTFSALSPEIHCGVRSSWDLPGHWQLDLGVRYVDSTPDKSVASYVAGDVQLVWRPQADWGFSLVGQNLFAGPHAEIATSTAGPLIEIPATVLAKVTWTFR